MAQFDVFSLASATTALLLAATLLVAYGINRRLGASVWWAGSFVLLAVWQAMATMRLGPPPPAWVQWVSWGSLYAAACLIAHGLHRDGATRVSPVGRMLACGALFIGLGSLLTVLGARPSQWFLIGPIPTLIFMTWSAVLLYRAGAWAYGLTLSAGIVMVALIPLAHPGGLARALAAGPPADALRGGFGGASAPGQSIPLTPPRTISGLIDITPPPGLPPPVEHPLAVTLLTVVALLALATALVLRDILAELDRMRHRSTTDAMTGLLNRDAFGETAEAFLGQTSAHPACVILFDIDHFKRINDTAGHAAGDRVISRLGQLLLATTGRCLAAGRVGGEEFAVIMARSDLNAARLFADTIREGLSASDFGDEIGWGVTLSAGIALQHPGENLHDMLGRADTGLYAAKNSGRNRVVAQDEPLPSPDTVRLNAAAG